MGVTSNLNTLSLAEWKKKQPPLKEGFGFFVIVYKSSFLENDLVEALACTDVNIM